MALAQGRDSSYVTSDIGAIEPFLWQSWHFSWKMGATSFVNVTALSFTLAANSELHEKRIADAPQSAADRVRVIIRSFQ
jgi:hypothetical protein